MTSRWTPSHVAAIADAALPAAPLIARNAAPRLLPDIDLWDHWPVQEEDGSPALIAGGELHMFLSAPARADPDARHGEARIRLMHRTSHGWRDLGRLLPEELSPGSREWAGSAVFDRADGTVTLYFTAAGRRGEGEPTFGQRLFETKAVLVEDEAGPWLADWSIPVECVAPDGAIYVKNMAGGGEIGTIKAFRDPAFFRNPADGTAYLLFAASLAQSVSPWNGAVGAARRAGNGWELLPPLVEADRLNNELERPHAIVHAGLYYLFWSTQSQVFAPGPVGPTGLYGMVAERLAGPWQPLNGTGLVLANPPEAPAQAFSWLVLPDLRVLSFADAVGLDRRPDDPEQARAHFGGTPAPELRLILDGAHSALG